MAVPSASGRAVESCRQPAWDLPALAAAGALPARRRADPGTAEPVVVDRDTADRLARAGLTSARLSNRSRIDGLALGAPVTAAFVGVMLAKGELGGAGAAGAEATVTAAHPFGPAGTGTGEAAAGGHAQIGSDEQASLEDGAARQAALDPVSAGAPGSATAEAAAGGPSGQAIPEVGAAGQGGAAAAAGVGAITINLAGMGPGLGEGLEGDGVATDEPVQVRSWLGGTEGDDTLFGTDGRDQLEGGAGDDLIYGLGGNDWIDGGSGDDALYGGAGDDMLLGDIGDDLLDGGTGDDLLLGGAGHDSLFGGAGNDQLDGGTGDDRLDGGSGIDRLSGGAGNDVLVIDHRDDLALEQSWGADGGGHDALQIADGFSGSPVTFVLGYDLAAAAEGTSGARHQVHGEIEDLVLTGAAGHDVIGDDRDNSLIGNAGSNALYGFAGDDFLQGGDGNDLLDGGVGADRLEGGAGHDILAGGMGDDELYGGSGDDRLAGGLGADRLYGEAGDDTYVIGLNDHAVDTVFDHEGSNHIILEGLTDQSVQAAIANGDLYVVVDANPVAIVSAYLGHEGSFAGIDLGAGIVAVEDLLAAGAGGGQQESAMLESAPELQGDLLASYLSQPSLSGTDAADQLSGTGGADWLQGRAGNDELHGGDGADLLEGGAGSDLLQGGAGDDRYLFRSGESGLDTIRDAEGSNTAELVGFTGARLEGVVVGHDLIVVADYAPIFKVENYVGNEASFAGVQVDDSFVSTEELFS
jgi:Ca2+-binding RTX toxin-like protein